MSTKGSVRYGLVAISLTVLFATNPNLEAHRDAVKEKINNFLRSEASATERSQNDDSKAVTEFGLMFTSVLAGKGVDFMIDRKNYYLFSLTTFEYPGGEDIVGLGILGHVFISDKVERRFGDKERHK